MDHPQRLVGRIWDTHQVAEETRVLSRERETASFETARGPAPWRPES
jgi:hypothetical protein